MLKKCVILLDVNESSISHNLIQKNGQNILFELCGLVTLSWVVVTLSPTGVLYVPVICGASTREPISKAQS